MKSRTLFASTTATLIAAILALVSSAVVLAKPTPQAAATLRPVPDKGAFRILLSGAEIGTEQFEMAATGNTWVVRSETVIRVPGEPESRSTGELHVSSDGTPLGYKWTAQTDKKASGVVEFENGTAKTGILIGSPVTLTRAIVPNAAAQAVAVSSAANFSVGNNLQVDSGASQEMVTVTAVTANSVSGIFSKNHAANAPVIRPYEQDFIFPSPRVLVLDNNLHYHFALLALLYNWNAKGQQAFPVLIPQDMTPGSVSVESLGTKTIEGTQFEALRVNTPDAEILAYFDTRRRLMRIEVPAASVAIVRR